MTMRHRRRQIDPAALAIISREGARGATASEVLRKISEAGISAESTPSRRTVDRILAELRTDDATGSWELAPVEELEPQDARHILKVNKAVQMWSYGRIRGVTQLEARWIASLVAADVGLNPHQLYRFARTYVARVAKHQPRRDLDSLLAWHPWTSPNGWGDYLLAVENGVVDAAPPWFSAELEGERDLRQSDGNDPGSWDFDSSIRPAEISERLRRASSPDANKDDERA